VLHSLVVRQQSSENVAACYRKWALGMFAWVIRSDIPVAIWQHTNESLHSWARATAPVPCRAHAIYRRAPRNVPRSGHCKHDGPALRRLRERRHSWCVLVEMDLMTELRDVCIVASTFALPRDACANGGVHGVDGTPYILCETDCFVMLCRRQPIGSRERPPRPAGVCRSARRARCDMAENQRAGTFPR
jgi:hypothetical protein